MLIDAFIKLAFDFQVLDYRFNYQVAGFELSEIVFEVANADERCRGGCKEGRRLRFLRRVKSRARNSSAHLF